MRTALILCLCIMCSVSLAAGESQTRPKHDFSYSFSVAGHSVVATALKSGKLTLVVDGKECKKYEKGLPYAIVGKLSIEVMANGFVYFRVGESDDDVTIEVWKRKEFPLKPPRNAKKLYVGKKLVTREKSTSGGDIYTHVTLYDFTCSLVSGELAYVVTQSPTSKAMTKEFRQVVETLKPRRIKK